jgi:lysophospholipase L1-like esterase
MKNFALNALALIVGVAISLSLLVAADFWMQGLANEKLAVGISVLRSQDDLLHHKFNPLASAVTYWGAEKFTIHTNSLAMRDDSKRHVSLNKTTDYRVLFLGDSFTEGQGVEFHESFVGRVGASFSNTSLEVLNAGVTSYSPINYQARLKGLLEKGLEIDEIFVFLDISDIEDSLVYKVEGTKIVDDPQAWENLAAGVARLDYERAFESFRKMIGYLSNKSYFLERFIPMNTVFHKTGVFGYSRGAWTYDQRVFDLYGRRGLELATRYMDQLHTIALRHNLALTLAIYPWPQQIRYDPSVSIHVSHWRKWAKNHNAGFINLFSAFASPGKPDAIIEKYFLRHDVHWNAAGHQVIADRVIRELRNSDLHPFRAPLFARK